MQQAAQGTGSSYGSSYNDSQSNPLSQMFQFVQQAGQIENGMGLTSLLSGGGGLMGMLGMFA